MRTRAGATAELPGAAPAASGAAHPAPAAAQQVIRLNLLAEPGTIDPQMASFIPEINVVMRVFSNVLTFDAKGHLVPEMADNMPSIASDGKTITCTLRRGLRYSDGRALTAKDFEYGWKRLLDPRLHAEYAFAGFAIEGAQEYHSSTETDTLKLGQLRAAVGVKAKDDRTLEFKLKHPAPWFLSVLATWCGVPSRQDMVERGEDRWTEPATYVGNGPYVLTAWVHHDTITLEANPNYYKGAPPLKTVRFAMIAEPAVALGAYRNDELDVVAVPKEDVFAVIGNPQLTRQYQRYAGTCTTYVGFNTKKAPFDKREVRRAFAAALDRNDFVRTVLSGLGVPADQFVPPLCPGHYPDLKGQTFDPPQAKQWLSDAGFGNGKGLPALKFTYAFNTHNKTRVDALIDQWRRTLGADVVADPVDPRTFTDLLKSPETTPLLFLLGWCQDYPDPQDWYSAVFSSKVAASHTGWANQAFDTLVEQADVELDGQQRHDLYKRAAQILVDDAPVAMLYYEVTSRLVKPYVANLPPNPLDYFEGQSNVGSVMILKH